MLLRHENVFPFSTSVEAFEVLQLASLVLGPIQNLGDQNYHFVTGTLDRKQDGIGSLTWRDAGSAAVTAAATVPDIVEPAVRLRYVVGGPVHSKTVFLD